MEKNDQLIAEFINYLMYERHYSELTIQAYNDDILNFLNFLKETGDSALIKVELSDARIYLTRLSDEQYKRSSISRKISSLRAFYQYLLNHGFIVENPFSYLHLKKTGLRLPNFFYEEEIEKVFEAASGEAPLDFRDKALLEVLYGTGIRVSECQSLRLEDIDLELGVLLVKGKGNRERYVPFARKITSFCIKSTRIVLNTAGFI